LSCYESVSPVDLLLVHTFEIQRGIDCIGPKKLKSLEAKRRKGGRVMGFVFWFSWALFIVFERITLGMPWPAKYFLVSQFADEFDAQRQVLKVRGHA
jgi:hypothetical protein